MVIFTGTYFFYVCGNPTKYKTQLYNSDRSRGAGTQLSGSCIVLGSATQGIDAVLCQDVVYRGECYILMLDNDRTRYSCAKSWRAARRVSV